MLQARVERRGRLDCRISVRAVFEVQGKLEEESEVRLDRLCSLQATRSYILVISLREPGEDSDL